MRVAGALLLLLLAALAGGLAGAAGGRGAAAITLRLQQTLTLAGTSVRCGSGHAAGLTFVDCGVVEASGQPKPGSYLALLAQNGKLSVVTRGGKIVFNRIGGPLSRRAGIVAHPGDVITLAGISTIACSAANVARKPTIFCDRVDPRGSFQPGSYAFGISDTVVTAIGWDAKRKAHLIDSWPENG